MSAKIVAAAESPYTRHPPSDITTEWLLADAFLRVLTSSGIAKESVDGLGVASFTLAPDHVADLAWRLGVRARWLMEDPLGGASALNLLQHALRAVEAGDAETIVLVSGDHFKQGEFRELVDSYNRVTVEHLAPIPTVGPNVLFAHLTQRYMEQRGVSREHFGRLVVAQRYWASQNPGAVYRQRLTLSEYLEAPIVVAPLHRYDCAPVVSGANAILVANSHSGVTVRSIHALHNRDSQNGDGLRTGLADLAPALWRDAGFGPEDLDAAYIYDDYPVMVLVQLEDLGFMPKGDVVAFVEQNSLPINTSGGQLSAGQAGAAGGMHGLVEAINQLLGMVGVRGVRARRAVVTGYGSVLYRYGSCANAAVLEST